MAEKNSPTYAAISKSVVIFSVRLALLDLLEFWITLKDDIFVRLNNHKSSAY